ncbi:MAG: NAD(P)/FAD-dependent oxidoreductase [Balneolaceae bacterium]
MGKNVIIVGGGFAGISAAKKLASSDFNVTIVDKTNHHLFQPLLYQVATAALSPGDIAMPIRAIFSKQKNVNVVLGEVTKIDKESRKVHLKDGSILPFNYLVLAPGAQYNYFGNDSWEKHAPGLKTISDALEIRERILLSLEKAEQISDPEKRKPYVTYVIIGGGPTGVEMAGSIAEIAKRSMMRDFRNIKPKETRIYLVEAAGSILNGFDDPLPEKGLETLRKMGVEVLLDAPVQDIKENGVQVVNRFIETQNIIWGAGVKASPLLKSLGLETDRMGRVMVEPDLSIPGDDHIFVAGDAAHVKDDNGKPLPGLAPVALQQGKYLGNLLKKEPSSRKPFHYVDKGTMATIGRAKAVADIRGFKFSGFFAWLMWGLIHIFFLIGFRNRFRVFAEWTWHYLTFKRGVRLIAKKGE